MPDPWDDFDQRVQKSGRLSKEIELLTDHELLTLLSLDCRGTREVEKERLREEALRRLPPSMRDASRGLVERLALDSLAPTSPEKQRWKEEIYARFS